MTKVIRPERWFRNPPLQTFPVTIVLGTQLIATIVAPATARDVQPYGLILTICALAVGAAAVVEIFTAPLKQQTGEPRPVSVKAAWIVLGIGIASSVGAAQLGRGTYEVQIGAAQESRYTAILTPFNVWTLFGTALFIWLFRQRAVSARTAKGAVALAVVSEVWIGLERAILGNAVAFAATILVMALLCGLVRLRVFIVGLAFIPIVWPIVYHYRDSVRQEIGGPHAIVSADDPSQRLELDKEMAYIGEIPRGSLTPVTPLTIVRTGLLPRAIDPHRPVIDTAQQISVDTGSQPTNSRSATFFGNVYLFLGLPGVALAGAATALAMGAAMRRTAYSPWAIAFVGVIYQAGISFDATYPKALAACLQSLESMAFAWFAVRYLTRRFGVPEEAQLGPATRDDLGAAKGLTLNRQ